MIHKTHRRSITIAPKLITRNKSKIPLTNRNSINIITSTPSTFPSRNPNIDRKMKSLHQANLIVKNIRRGQRKSLPVSRKVSEEELKMGKAIEEVKNSGSLSPINKIIDSHF